MANKKIIFIENLKDVSRIRKENYRIFDINKAFSMTYYPKSKSVKELDMMTFFPYLTGIDFLVSKKLKDILNFCMDTQMNIIPVKIENFINDNYYLVGIPIIEYEEIDFEKTIFIGINGVELQFQNVNEYKSFDKSVLLKSLVVKRSNYSHIIATVWGTFFSESLIKQLEENGITGYELHTDRICEVY